LAAISTKEHLSMAGRIKITPEEVRRVSTQFKTTSNEGQGQITKLKTTIDGMRGDWEGLTSQKFYTDYQDWSKAMTTYVEVLKNIGVQLDAIASRFQEADRAR